MNYLRMRENMDNKKVKGDPAARKLARWLRYQSLYLYLNLLVQRTFTKEDIEIENQYCEITPCKTYCRKKITHRFAGGITGTGMQQDYEKKKRIFWLCCPKMLTQAVSRLSSNWKDGRDTTNNIAPYGEILQWRQCGRSCSADSSYLTAPTFYSQLWCRYDRATGATQKVLEPIMEATGRKSRLQLAFTRLSKL